MFGDENSKDQVISVFCSDVRSSRSDCYATLTRADGNLDYIAADHRRDRDPFAAVRRVPVTRKDARVPREIAMRFRDCFLRAFPRYGDHRLRLSEDLHMDRVEFWLIDDRGTRNGERPDEPGRGVKTLMHLADLFARYCEVREPVRLAILTEIEREQGWLLKTLRR
jgi:hypothetical protein